MLLLNFPRETARMVLLVAVMERMVLLVAVIGRMVLLVLVLVILLVS